MAYDPCQVIHYVVNPTGGPAEYENLFHEAVEEVSKLTGLAFQFDGPTDRRPPLDTYATTGAANTVESPVLMAWSTPAEQPRLVESSGYAGSERTNASGVLRYTTGSVTLDAEYFALTLRAVNGKAIARAIVLHELGHLVGLDHVSDPVELMAFPVTGLVTEFGPGDRQGLAALGAGSCVRAVQ